MNRHKRTLSLVITVTVVGLVVLGSPKEPAQLNHIYVSTQNSKLNGQHASSTPVRRQFDASLTPVCSTGGTSARNWLLNAGNLRTRLAPEEAPAAALSKLKTQNSLFSLQPTFAQSVSPRDVWRQVYKQLPDLPLENQYVNNETGKVDSDNTLANRLIGYHIYVKGRASIYRLDWKLTLADYLGANELILEETYPGFETLRSNPITGDRAAIERLNRQQRDTLVQTLVSIFNSNYSAPAQTPPQPSTAPSPDTRNSPQPRPGDAQLLMP